MPFRGHSATEGQDDRYAGNFQAENDAGKHSRPGQARTLTRQTCKPRLFGPDTVPVVFAADFQVCLVAINPANVFGMSRSIFVRNQLQWDVGLFRRKFAFNNGFDLFPDAGRVENLFPIRAKDALSAEFGNEFCPAGQREINSIERDP